MYPVDWLEERSGLVGAIRYFLFRKVPADTELVPDARLGDADRVPDPGADRRDPGDVLQARPDEAYPSIQHITNDLWAGWLVRGMHRWGASVFIILMFLHMGRVFLFGAYKYPRELNWIIGVLLLALGLAEGFTGYLLPWDQTSYWATTVGININATAPFLGPFLAQFLQGGASINADTLSRFYAIHMLLLPGAIFALIGAAPLPRDPPRRHLAAVVEACRRLRARSTPTAGAAAHRADAARAAWRLGVAEDRVAQRAARLPPVQGRTSRSAGSRSIPTRCSTTRSCRSSSSS